MSESTKKQSFLHGAMLLAIATAVVKVIGALYKLPLNRIIGAEGFALFTTAYEIYAVLLMISTAGLPVAMSRMVSQSSALGEYNQVRQIYRVSRTLFVSLGALSSLFMVALCHWLANRLNQPNAWATILCLGPSALFICLMSAYRGFSQGQGNMRPTSNSQMLEAVVKLVVGLGAAIVVLKLTSNIALAAGGAIFGVTVSCVVSTIYLRIKFVPDYKSLPNTQEKPRSFGGTAKSLLAIAVPITIGAAGMQLLTVFETGLYMDRLVHLIDTNQYMSHMVTGEITAQRAATMLKGAYNMSQTIYNMPTAFIVPITISVIPAITSQLTVGNHRGVRSTEESAARITSLLSMPCAVGLCLLAGPVMKLLGGYSGELLEQGTLCLMLLGVNVFLYSVLQYVTAILQAHGKAYVPVVNMLIAGVLKLAAVYVLTGNPAIGILGVPIGTTLCHLCVLVLNLISVRFLVPQKPALIRNLLRPLLPAAIMGAAVYGVSLVLEKLLGSDGSTLLLCGIPVAVGVVVYAGAAIVCKVITREDCQLLPKGDKIAKLFHL